MDRSLRHADVLPKLGLAPVKDCPRQTYLRGKSLPFKPNEVL